MSRILPAAPPVEKGEILNAEADWQSLGLRLRRAREVAGFTQQEAADALGVSRPSLSQIEAGRTRIDSLALRRLAGLYRQSIDGFFQDDNEADRQDMSAARRISERLNQVLAGSPSEDRVVIARFLEFCDSLASLRKLLGRVPKAPPPPHDLGPRARKYAAEAAATEERDWLGLADAPVGERIFDLLEELGIPTYTAPLTGDRVSGLLVNHPEAGWVIFVNSKQYRWRRVFTAAHEFGHILFHRPDQLVACRIFGDYQESEDVAGEAFVNAFTSEFLMPSKGVKRYLKEIGAASDRLSPGDVVRLHRYFGVSFEAMLYRLRRLRLITEPDVQTLKDGTKPVALAWRLGYEPEPEEFGDDTNEDSSRLVRQFPREFLALVLEAFEAGRISNGRAAELLELNRLEFDRFYRMLVGEIPNQIRDEGLENVVG